MQSDYEETDVREDSLRAKGLRKAIFLCKDSVPYTIGIVILCVKE